MINDNLLKSLFKMKFEVMTAMTNMLPDHIQEPVQKLQNKVIHTIHEVTEEYIEKGDMTKEKKSLKSIEIE
ncbi:hypothetical protein SAMN05446037_1009111 [Anaerovirgula multivorans]|uniref:Uncharacterized protein n=1 Tax=Anaerovirgula multivorans TaxID=312168 RepID=A0A239E7I3_9FIRM|nr:hypothetical protein [Anaerovirgula multivorans]SNS40606.1 hypothetical protein SAMN05446037_1009111 [Anaerovirgula multivorans]